ncbi:MAG: 3-deoxy-manno-octulosonate cytidylyltransferase [Planctomycetota bacterium]
MSPAGGAAIAIVPVRLGSARLPRKALLEECGRRPLFLHTVAQAGRATLLDEVVVATDSDEVRERAEEAGVRVVMTGPEARTGSERCAMALPALPEAGIVIDVQGDWPEVPPEDLDALVEALRGDGEADIATLSCALDSEADFRNPHVVKVVTGARDQALYFSRAPIPSSKGGVFSGDKGWRLGRRHVGVYAVRRAALASLPDLPDSPLEQREELEQLRWLAAGLTILVLPSKGRPRGIETRDDYEGFLTRLSRSRGA